MIGVWDLQALVERFGGVATSNVNFSGVSTDTRTIKPGDLFVALVGPNFDGHNFIDKAADKGAVAAVVSHEVKGSGLPQWQVSDTRLALGNIAMENRQRFSGKVLAVTGSSGKTTVKEMLNSILSQGADVLATKGNLNNDIGVPLTLFGLGEAHQYAVIEQGASAIGEIGYTTAISQPDIAILNNAMGAHLEGFGSLQGVVEAKSEIFSQLSATQGTAIVNLDDPNVSFWLEKTKGYKRLTFSAMGKAADLTASDFKSSDYGCYSFSLHHGTESKRVRLKVMGQHNVANALAAAAATRALGLSFDEIVTGLERFVAVDGRMKTHRTVQGALLIDDSYNANPGSVCAAIDLLVDLPGDSVLVLGDMAELGADAAEQHAKVGCRAAQKGVGRLWATGALSRHSVSAYEVGMGNQGRYFETKEALIASLKEIDDQNLNILVKGSRSAAMDQVVRHLMKGE